MSILSKIMNIAQRGAFTARNIWSELTGDGYVINSYAWQSFDGTIEHSNWGDDINWYFLREIIDGKIISYDHALLARHFNRPNYVVIGSTIDLRADEKSVIWGAGIIDGSVTGLPKFKEIRAVRGPKTRQKLLSLGIDCPEVYGDPALLLPLHYKPDIEKTHRIGIIPHFHDLEHVRKKIEQRKDIKLIDIRHYEEWTSVVDEILSCELIASSSLHGLIVSFAYGIPNVWVEFPEGELRDRFKYDDFFASIGIEESPIELSMDDWPGAIESAIQHKPKGRIDLKSLIDASPFKLKNLKPIPYSSTTHKPINDL